MRALSIFFVCLFFFETLSAQLKVASLHPLMTDLVKQVGKEHIVMTAVAKPGTDLHKFRPSSKDIRGLSSCRLVFASGKNFESFLNDIRPSLPAGANIVEVGKNIPSQVISKNDALYACCPEHSFGAIDPHWWHSAANMQRAARIVTKALSAADPQNAGAYKINGKAAERYYAELHKWAKSQIAKIPRADRKLVTAHAAFGYFCKTYGFKPNYVQGISPEHEISNKQLAETILDLKKFRVKAVFPEQGSNPKTLKQIARETGAKIGDPLVADGSVQNYEAMFKRNVDVICAALK